MKISSKQFIIINILVILISIILIFYGIDGSIQERINILKSFSIPSIKLVIKTIALLFLGFIFLALFFQLLKVSPTTTTSKSKYWLLIISWILYFISLTLLLAKRWAEDRFPMQQPEIIFLNAINYNGEGIDKSIFIEAGIIIFIGLLISLFFFLVTYLLQSKTSFSFLKTQILRQININILYFIFCFFLFSFSIFDISKDLKITEYFSLISNYKTPSTDSEFYISEYITPEYENVIFPEKKKNLIIILLESMESSFSDFEHGGILDNNLIPNLTEEATKNLNFSNTDKIGGGTDLSGTGWTIAGMTAKFAGLPYNLIGAENKKYSFFLPGAITLNDILNYNNYNQLFIFGSDKSFGGRDALLETHGNVEIHDIEWYKNHNMLPKDYSVFWGFEDKKLYEFAKLELDNLSQQDKPFMFGLLTVDTHMPTGYQCENCPATEDMPLKNSVLCADKMISDFLDWCKTQSWYDNTTIVIMGDHLFMATKETNPFGNDDYITMHSLKNELEGMDNNPRRWLDIFINASPVYENYNIKNRKFSSLDMFPTILASIGCTIKDDKLGFGVNLFSNEKTLCERFQEEYINSQIMSRNKQYESLEVDIQ